MTTGRINQVTTLYTECLHVDLSSRKSEALAVLLCTKLLNESRALFRVSQPSVGLDFYQNESWNDECNNESLHRLVYQSRLPSFLGYRPTIKITPDSGMRIKARLFKRCQRAIRFSANHWWRCNLCCKVCIDGEPRTIEGKAPKDTRTHK
jgi:hypothetical protein